MRKMLLGLTSLTMATSVAAIEAPHVPGEIIVKFKEGRERSFFANQAFRGMGVEGSRDINLSYEKLSVLKVSDKSFSMTNILHELNNHPDIEYAEPNFIYTIDPVMQASLSVKKLIDSPFADMNVTLPNDPQFGQLWGMRNTGSNEPKGKAGVEGADINALKAWELTKGDSDIVIAVIDTGVDYNHPDLKQNRWINTEEIAGNGIDDDGNGYIDDIYGYNFAKNTSDPMDRNGHGTHCAGTIGAIHDNSVGVSGVMANVKMMAVKFLGDDGSGSLEGAIKAIDYATNKNVDIMSNSWGGGGRSQALLDAIMRASDKGIIFVAAAGNSSANNDASPSYPASYETPNMVSVASMTAQNTLSSFSSYGRNSVHIAAPGTNILSTVPNGKYDVYSGTSMATPHVSGILGLLLSQEGRMDHAELRDRLTMTGVPVAGLRGKTQTASRVDAFNLLTNHRPERNLPKGDAWVTERLSEVFESEHPYKDNVNVTRTITVPGAKFIRVRVEKYDLERGYDYVRLSDKDGNAVEKITGTGTNYVSDYVEGDTIVLDFVTDRSQTKWGFVISEIDAQ